MIPLESDKVILERKYRIESEFAPSALSCGRFFCENNG